MTSCKWATSGSLRRGFSAAIMVALLFVTACATTGQSGSASAGGPSVPAGATKQEYIDALSSADPIELVMQPSGSPGSLLSSPDEKYAAAIEEWSGGKIKIDLVYDVISSSAEAVDAMSDGRLDLGGIDFAADPSRYSAVNALADTATITGTSVLTGTLQTTAAVLESGFEIPAISEGYSQHGVTSLLPAVMGGNLSLYCGEPRSNLDELDGTLVRVPGKMQSAQVEALGMSPVSLEYTELFQALQRGTVDCLVTVPLIAEAIGVLPVAKHTVIPSESGLGRAGISFGVSTAKWKSLPIAAQQLLFDRLDVYLEHISLRTLQATAKSLESVVREGGTISILGPEAQSALRSANDQILGDLEAPPLSGGKRLVTAVEKASTRWEQVVTGELDYSDEVDYSSFAEWFSPEKVDLERYIDRLRTDVLNKNRPE